VLKVALSYELERHVVRIWEEQVASIFRVEEYARLRCACCLLHDGFLLVSFVDPEEGGAMFFRNIRWLSTEYTALYRNRHYFSH
jgi:hypothetical protein